MVGDLIRFPGRSRVTSEAHKEQADSGAKPAEHNGVSRLLRASIAAQSVSYTHLTLPTKA